MRKAIAMLFALMISIILSQLVLAAPSTNDSKGKKEEKPQTVMVGTSSESILPLVNGSLDYFNKNKDKLPDPNDPVSPGIFVKEFDDGKIAVGNGDSDAHWVRDDLRATAIAIENPKDKDKKIVVMLSTDLYMIFRDDANEIRKKANDLLPPGLAKRVEVFITSTHTHHGPDTAFDVNHKWYDYMTDQAAKAVAEAVKSRKAATLKVGQGQHWFGIRDSRDPQIIDPTMNVLQAEAMNGKVIATVVQWNLHPETTLFWDPPADISEDCKKLGWEGNKCSAKDRYFSSDFVGWMTKTIQNKVGGEVLYFQGAIGGLMTQLSAPVWEITDKVGIGNHYTPPEGAVPAGGSEYSFTDKNFRRAVVIGEQAGIAALKIMEKGEFITRPDLSIKSQEFFTRMSNIGFRALLVANPETKRSQLGHNTAMLYNCPANGPKTDKACQPDEFNTMNDPIVGKVRAGDHMKTEVSYLKIGAIGMMFVPGEITGELVMGLPNGFFEQPEKWFSGPLDKHAKGEEYEIPGYIVDRMNDKYRWVIGLGNDELGYVIPLSDWRIYCVGDALGKSGTCKQLYDAGVIAYPDSLSGYQCKEIVENPAILEKYPKDIAEVLKLSCQYGQVIGEASSHYEETNSVGWDLASDILSAVAALTGNHSNNMINENFEGYWQGNPPPATKN